MDFSCGCIDNKPGPHTVNALKAFQRNRHLPETGLWDAATQQALPLTEIFTTYLITAKDQQAVMIPPKTTLEKSQAKLLGYYSLAELLAEKFHLTQAFLRQLNADVPLQPGLNIRVPNLTPPDQSPPTENLKAAAIKISLSEESIEALDGTGLVMAHFPCSIAADKKKRPVGNLTVVNYAPNPNYTFDPVLFPDLAAKEHLTQKLIFPPGPNNPVGLIWIGLSLPSYGIHGTPEPEKIGTTFSHGCFRLTNWDGLRLFHLIKLGTPVTISP